MNSREQILDKIKDIKHEIFLTDILEQESYINASDKNDLETFKERILENKSILVESSELEKSINKIIEKEKVESLLYSSSIKIDMNEIKIQNKCLFDLPIENFKEKIFSYDLSIIEADYGVSSHGVVCITSKKDQPRLLSLTPKVCICLLKKEKIVQSIAQAIKEIKKSNENRLPTNTLFISGPSRTADIELQTVLGVHGSQIFYLILY